MPRRARPVVALLAVLAAGGSVRADGPVVHRIDDPKLVARLARDIAARQATLDARILCAQPLAAWSEPQYAVLREHADEVLERLRDTVEEMVARGPDEQALGRRLTVQNALRVMSHIDPEAGLDAALPLIEHPDLVTAVLRTIGRAPPAALAGRDGLWEIAAPYLDDADRLRRASALQAAAAIDPARARPFVEAALEDRGLPPNVAGDLLVAVAPPDEALAYFIEHGPLYRVARFSTHEDPEVRARAIAAVRANDDQGYLLSPLIDGLAAQGDDGMSGLVEIMNDDGLPAYPRSKALAHVIERRGRDAPGVREAAASIVSDPAVAGDTLAAVAYHFRGTGDAALVAALHAVGRRERAALAEMAANPDDERNRTRYEQLHRRNYAAEAVLRIAGVEAVDSVRAWCDGDEKEIPPRVRLAQRGLDDDALLDRIRASGLAPDASFERCRDLAAWWSPMELALELLRSAGTGVRFDAEADTFPVRHDRLVAQFAAGSAGRLDVAAVDQVDVPDPRTGDGGHYRVRVIANGSYYEFRANRGGDWYDTQAVVGAVNRMLADAGADRRFHQFEMGQVVGYFCATDAQAAVLRDEFGIGMYDAPSAAPVEAAQEYEEQVRRAVESGDLRP